MIGGGGQAPQDLDVGVGIERRAGDDLAGRARAEMPPEQENVASMPPGASSFSASRLMSLYARAARSACAAVGANLGGSRTMRSNVAASLRNLRRSVNDVGFDPFVARRGERRIARDVLAAERERLRRAVDRHDAAGAARERGQREPAACSRTH